MLKRINDTMQVRMTLDEANYINELIERDTPKAMKEYTLSNNSKMALCPVCETVINRNFCYCQNCGQRVDIENFEI